MPQFWFWIHPREVKVLNYGYASHCFKVTGHFDDLILQGSGSAQLACSTNQEEM